MRLTETITTPELIWTIFTLFGLVFNGHQFEQAINDLMYVRKHGINHIREYAAVTTMIMFGSWTVVQFLFFVLGCFLMTIHTAHEMVSVTQYMLAVGFVLISALMAITGYVVDRRRRTLIARLMREDVA